MISTTMTTMTNNTLHVSLDTLFLTQEKIVITKEKAKNFDNIFEYPCWVNFSDEANNIIFKKILDNELSDEQIDYFIGASDTIHHYDEWFKVVKHIFAATKNAHVFWTAGDILNIIWKAVPDDAKSQKWFKDEIYNIFWPHVDSIWPLLNQNAIKFDQNEKSKILKDSIGWLQSLDDLKERLPELGKDFELYEQHTNETDFAYIKGLLIGKLSANPQNIDEILNQFYALSDYACTEKHVTELQKIADSKLIPLIDNVSNIDTQDTINMIQRAIAHARDYIATLAREEKNLIKLVK